MILADCAFGRTHDADRSGQFGRSVGWDVGVRVGHLNDGVLRESDRGAFDTVARRSGESGNSECESGDEASGNSGHHAGGHDALLECWLVLHLCLLVWGALPVFAAAVAVTGHTFVVVPMNLPKNR